MKARFSMASLLAGIAIGAVALQGLHAQGAKQKAYSVSELEILDASAQAAYLAAARKALEAAHGHALRTTTGRVVQIDGGAAPRMSHSSNGIVWMTLWLSTNQKSGRTSRLSVTRQPRLSGGTSSRPKSSRPTAGGTKRNANG